MPVVGRGETGVMVGGWNVPAVTMGWVGGWVGGAMWEESVFSLVESSS